MTSTIVLDDSAAEDDGIVGLLDDLCARCVDLLGADAAVVLLGDAHDQLRVAAASTDVVTMEPLVLQSDDNPYVQCYRTSAPVRIPDIDRVRSRWPEFVVALERAGASRAVHVLPLRSHDSTIGALSLFHRSTGFLSHTDLAVAQALADVIALGVVSERIMRRGEMMTGQVEAALTDRIVIEQATGAVAQCTGLGVDAAFTLLREHGRRRGQRLVELARQIVTRDLDPVDLFCASPRAGRHRHDGP